MGTAPGLGDGRGRRRDRRHRAGTGPDAPPLDGLLADELAAIGIGVGLIDALGVLALSIALLVVVLAGAARTAGVLGMAAHQRGLLGGDED